MKPEYIVPVQGMVEDNGKNKNGPILNVRKAHVFPELIKILHPYIILKPLIVV